MNSSEATSLLRTNLDLKSEAQFQRIEEQLLNHPVFKLVAETFEVLALNTVARKCRVQTYVKGEILIQKGEKAPGLFLVQKGSIGVYCGTWNQVERISISEKSGAVGMGLMSKVGIPGAQSVIQNLINKRNQPQIENAEQKSGQSQLNQGPRKNTLRMLANNKFSMRITEMEALNNMIGRIFEGEEEEIGEPQFGGVRERMVNGKVVYPREKILNDNEVYLLPAKRRLNFSKSSQNPEDQAKIKYFLSSRVKQAKEGDMIGVVDLFYEFASQRVYTAEEDETRVLYIPRSVFKYLVKRVVRKDISAIANEILIKGPIMCDLRFSMGVVADLLSGVEIITLKKGQHIQESNPKDTNYKFVYQIRSGSLTAYKCSVVFSDFQGISEVLVGHRRDFLQQHVNQETDTNIMKKYVSYKYEPICLLEQNSLVNLSALGFVDKLPPIVHKVTNEIAILLAIPAPIILRHTTHPGIKERLIRLSEAYKIAMRRLELVSVDNERQSFREYFPPRQPKASIIKDVEANIAILSSLQRTHGPQVLKTKQAFDLQFGKMIQERTTVMQKSRKVRDKVNKILQDTNPDKPRWKPSRSSDRVSDKRGFNFQKICKKRPFSSFEFSRPVSALQSSDFTSSREVIGVALQKKINPIRAKSAISCSSQLNLSFEELHQTSKLRPPSELILGSSLDRRTLRPPSASFDARPTSKTSHGWGAASTQTRLTTTIDEEKDILASKDNRKSYSKLLNRIFTQSSALVALDSLHKGNVPGRNSSVDSHARQKVFT